MHTLTLHCIAFRIAGTEELANDDKVRSAMEKGLAEAEKELAAEQAAREERERLDALENARVDALLALRKTCKETWVRCHALYAY